MIINFRYTPAERHSPVHVNLVRSCNAARLEAANIGTKSHDTKSTCKDYMSFCDSVPFREITAVCTGAVTILDWVELSCN